METRYLNINKLLEKISFGSKDPFQNKDGFYYILYMTTCISNNKIYIGVRSTKNYLKDRYIGCGINSGGLNKSRFGISHFKNAVDKYGYENFKRENLLFFSSREDALRAESIIVTKEFVSRKETLNSCIGGGSPPRKRGEDNGNYGNRWTDLKRKEISDYFKENRDTSGVNNTRATKTFVLNIFNNDITEFDCIMYAEDFLKLKRCTISAMRRKDPYHIFRKKYICLREKPSEEELRLIFNNIILKVKAFSRIRKQDIELIDFLNKRI